MDEFPDDEVEDVDTPKSGPEQQKDALDIDKAGKDELDPDRKEEQQAEFEKEKFHPKKYRKS